MKDDSTAANDHGGSKTHKKRKQRDESSPAQPKPSKSSKKRKVNETAEDTSTAPPAAPVAKEDKELQGIDTSVADEAQKTNKKRKKRKSDVAEPSGSAATVISPETDSKRRDSTDLKEASEAKMGQRMSYEDVREQERLQAEKEKSGKSKKKGGKKQQPNGVVTEEPSTDIATVDGPSTSEKKKRKKKEKVQPADIDATEGAIPDAKEENGPTDVPTTEMRKKKKKRKSKSTGEQTTATTGAPRDEDAELHDLKRREAANGSQEVQEIESPPVEASISKKKRKHRDSDDGPPPADPTSIEEVESTQVEKSKKKKRKHHNDGEAVSASAETTQEHIETPIEPQNTEPAPSKPKKRKRDRKDDTHTPQEDALVETETQDPPSAPDTTLPDRKKRRQKHKSPKPVDLTDPLTILMPPPPTPDPNRASKTKPRDLLPLPFDPPIPPKPTVPKSLRRLLDPNPSPFTLSRMTLLLDINPIGLLYAQETALAACLAPLVGSYFTPLDGLILSFHAPWMQNAPPKSLKRSLPNKSATRILDAAHAADLAFAEAHPDEEPPDPEETELAKLKKVKGLCHDEDEAPKVWISASFLLFRPRVGMKLTGFVNMQTESSVSLLLYNLFTVSIDAKRLGPGFSWVAAGSGMIKSPDKTTSLKSSPVKGGSAMDIDEDANPQEEEDETALIAGHWVYTPPAPAPKTPPSSKVKSKSTQSKSPIPLKPGHALTFRILNYDIQTNITESGAPSSFVSIEGTLLTHRREREAIEEEKERWMKRWGPKSELDESRDWEGAIGGFLRKTRLEGEDGDGDGDAVMSGALVDDEAEEGEDEDDEGEGEDLMDED